MSQCAVRQSIIIIEICRGMQGNRFRKRLPTLKVTFKACFSYAKDTLNREVNMLDSFWFTKKQQSTQSLAARVIIISLTCTRIVRFFQRCSEVVLKTSTLSATLHGTEAVCRTRHTDSLTS